MPEKKKVLMFSSSWQTCRGPGVGFGWHQAKVLHQVFAQFQLL